MMTTENKTLNEALAEQGIWSSDCETPNKRDLFGPDNRYLGKFSAAEAWEGLNNGFLVYR